MYGLAGRGVVRRTTARRSGSPRGCAHGTVWINDFHPYVPQAEWGGFGSPASAASWARAGLAEYREAKHIWRNTAPGPPGWFPSTAATPGSGS